MTDSESLRRLLSRGVMTVRDSLVNHVYTGSIRSIGDRTGVDSTLRSVDTAIVKRIPASDRTITAGEITCTFAIDSVAEARWFEKYPETGGDMPVLEELVETVHPDDDFWDVGSNVGIYSCLVSQVLEDGSITAIEPHPKNARRIKRNLKLNDTSGKVYRQALAAESGTLELRPAASDVTGSYGSVHYPEYHGEPFIVQALPGDTFRARENVPSPDVMKIDVEGAEYDVLSGLEGTLTGNGPRVIYCNICSGMKDDVDDEVEGLLDTYRYDVERIWEWPDGQGHYVRAEGKSNADS